MTVWDMLYRICLALGLSGWQLGQSGWHFRRSKRIRHLLKPCLLVRIKKQGVRLNALFYLHRLRCR